MTRMTWKEFKNAVEAHGVKDDDELSFINWNAQSTPHPESLTRLRAATQSWCVG
jgi:hypothetical protein